MIYSYKDAKKLIEESETWLDKELMAFLCERKGYQVQEHRRYRWGLGMRQAGTGPFQSLPDFDDFDSIRNFLLDDRTRVVLLQQKHMHSKLIHPWRCSLDRLRDKAPPFVAADNDQGSGYGHSPAHALAAAWLDLEVNRSHRPLPASPIIGTEEQPWVDPMPETEMRT
jgi:hypothetical protein